jgi:DNA repair exonuclease SbcCD ATPase subunit
MQPCLSLEEAISQLKDSAERKEVDYQFQCYKNDIRDKIELLEAEAEKADDFYQSWQDAEDECNDLSNEIDELSFKLEDLDAIKAELEKISGQSISADVAFHTLNKLLHIVNEAKVQIT